MILINSIDYELIEIFQILEYSVEVGVKIYEEKK